MTDTLDADTLATLEAVEHVSSARPSLLYSPGRTHDLWGNPVPPERNGQLQFHRAPHVFRIAAPGNGFGKTTLAAVEIDWWGHGDHPWQKLPTRRAFRQMMWVAQKFQQFEMMKPQLEAWWPEYVRSSWRGQPFNNYTWPDGSQLFVITSETDWETIQGIEPDLIVMDEEPSVALWRELQRRRRGKVETRFVVTATATKGLTWTYRELYLPWQKYHQTRGIPEGEAMQRQEHRFEDTELADLPGIWCWPQGSHADNPTATLKSWALYQQMTAGSEAERQVRLYGGFRDFSGSPVFNPDAIDRMRPALRQGRRGVVRDSLERGARVQVFDERLTVPGGSITVYHEPAPHVAYTLGLDCALGLTDGDFDVGIVLDEKGRECCVVEGRWGETFLDIILPLIEWYHPFIVGERTAHSLAHLRRLHDMGAWLYHERDEAKAGRAVRDVLGHAPKQYDLTVARLREAVAPKDEDGRLKPSRVEVYDEETLRQLSRYSFRPRSSTKTMEEARDADLVWSAPPGEHDDRVRALALAWVGFEWLPRFPKPPPNYRPGTAGHLLKWAHPKRKVEKKGYFG